MPDFNSQLASFENRQELRYQRDLDKEDEISCDGRDCRFCDECDTEDE